MAIHTTWRRIGAAALMTMGASAASAQSSSATAWRELTLADLQAAHDIIARNHPAATPTARDSAFRFGLAEGLRAGRERAASVSSYEGWLATLRAFAVGFQDPHISLGTRLSITSVRWPGFVVGRRGAATVVASRDTSTAPDLPALNAELVSCDGVPIETYAEQRLGVFRGTWDVASQRVRTTPWLLVDDGNPFLPPARACAVRERGRERTVELRWRTVAAASLQERVREAAPVGRAGFGVRRAGQGWWIALQSLGGEAAAVIDSVDRRAEALRASPWVVVDVRGNGGGSSQWAVRLATTLMGDARVQAAMRRGEQQSTGELCGTSWRASAEVEETLEGYIRNLGPRLGPASVAQWQRELDSLRAARREGRELAPAPRTCSPATRSAANDSLPPSRMQGRLVLLTDHACFSSCLLMTGLFRLIGALHVGEGTDFSTRYMEVRGFPLPSGLGTFATLQKAAFGMALRLGPFEPEVAFPGRMDDTAALETWIQQLMTDRR